MATISFTPRGSKDLLKIYVVVSNGRKNVFRRYTGFDVFRNDWSFKTGRPKQNDDKTKKLDTDLINLRSKLNEKINDATAKGEPISGEWLQMQLDIFSGKFNPNDEEKREREKYRLINYFDRYINTPPIKQTKSKPRTKATLTKYITLKNKIQSFEQHTKRKYYIKDVNIDFRDSFFEYLTTIEKLSDNTAGRYLTFVKTVCLDARARGAETHSQLEIFSGSSEEAYKIHFTFDELEQLSETKFVRPALENARDWLIIGCYIGQRVGDLLNLTSKNIVSKNGLNLIELTQQKTGKTVLIPISEPVQEILNKRNGEFPHTLSRAKFNQHIKDVAKIAGFNEILDGAKIEPIENGDTTLHRKKIGKYEKWELVTSHICRRSFATNYYGLMVTSLIINITGHSTEKQFLEYVGKPPIDHAQAIADYFTSIYHQQIAKREKQPVLLSKNVI